MNKFDKARIDIVKDETLSKNWYHLRNVTFDYTGSSGETVRLKREVYDRGNGATILLFDPKRQTLVLVRQFRVPVHAHTESVGMVAAPAGMLDGDLPTEASRREVMEESGYVVHDVRPIFRSFMSPGAVTEIIHFFVALIDAGERQTDGGGLDSEHEDIEVLEIGLGQASAMIDSGEICDAKTIMLIQWALIHQAELTAV